MTALSIPERARALEMKYGLLSYENAIAALTEAMRSERELCAKELRDYKATVHWPESNTVESCIEVLREGGQR